MTTNAIDRLKGLVASDSRWSIDSNDLLMYVDDTGYEKISFRESSVIIFAGDGVLIDAWKKWFATAILDTDNLPDVERTEGTNLVGVTVFLLNVPSGEIEHGYGWVLFHEDEAIFAGSGADAALECFSQNKCGKQAVLTASSADPATGGKVKFFDIKTGETNVIKDSQTLQDANRELWERGFIMDKKTGETAPISSFSARAAGALEAMKGVSLSAPTGPTLKWTDAAKADLKAALERVAAREASARAK